MAKFTVAMDIKKIYHVTVSASNAKAAARQVEAMQSTEIEERGSLKDVETEFIEVKPA